MIERKVTASGLGAALATVLWTLLAWFNTTVADKAADAPESYTAVVGATAFIFAVVAGYWVPSSEVPDAGSLDGTDTQAPGEG